MLGPDGCVEYELSGLDQEFLGLEDHALLAHQHVLRRHFVLPLSLEHVPHREVQRRFPDTHLSFEELQHELRVIPETGVLGAIHCQRLLLEYYFKEVAYLEAAGNVEGGTETVFEILLKHGLLERFHLALHFSFAFHTSVILFAKDRVVLTVLIGVDEVALVETGVASAGDAAGCRVTVERHNPHLLRPRRLMGEVSRVIGIT